MPPLDTYAGLGAGGRQHSDAAPSSDAPPPGSAGTRSGHETQENAGDEFSDFDLPPMELAPLSGGGSDSGYRASPDGGGTPSHADFEISTGMLDDGPPAPLSEGVATPSGDAASGGALAGGLSPHSEGASMDLDGALLSVLCVFAMFPQSRKCHEWGNMPGGVFLL